MSLSWNLPRLVYPFLHHPITHTHLDIYLRSNVCVITWLMVLSSCSHCVWSWRECSYPSYTGRRKHTCIYIHTVHSHTHTSTLRFCFLGGEAAGQEQWAACLASQSSSSLFLFSPFSFLSPSHVLQVMTRTKWTNYTLWFQTKQQAYRRDEDHRNRSGFRREMRSNFCIFLWERKRERES